MYHSTRHVNLAFRTRLRQTLAVMAFLAGASFCLLGAQWHSQGTFYYLNQLPIPWWVYGIAFIAAAVLIMLPKCRAVGFLIGAILYSFFGIAAWLAVLGGLHSDFWLLSSLQLPANVSGNIFAAINMTTIAMIYWWCVRESIYRIVDPERLAQPTESVIERSQT